MTVKGHNLLVFEVGHGPATESDVVIFYLYGSVRDKIAKHFYLDSKGNNDIYFHKVDMLMTER